MKKLRMIITAALAVAFLGAFSLPSAAVNADAASGKADLGAGSGIKFGTLPSNPANPFDPNASVNTCTLSAIGYDSSDNLVGISVGHCPFNTQNVKNDPTWSQVSGVKDSVLGQVGTVVKSVYQPTNSNGTPKATDPDYSVILFDKDKVNPLQTVGRTTVNGIATTLPANGSIACKEGRTTAQTCARVGSSDSNQIRTAMMFAMGGDSGSPLVNANDGKLIGYLQGSGGFLGLETTFVNIHKTLNAINTAGGVGSGFHL